MFCIGGCEPAIERPTMRQGPEGGGLWRADPASESLNLSDFPPSRRSPRPAASTSSRGHGRLDVARYHWTQGRSSRGCAKQITQRLAATAPGRYTIASAPDKRTGRIFVDYLRNGRGTTATGAWSPRARAGFPVSAPVVSWRQVENGIRPVAFTMDRPQAGRRSSALGHRLQVTLVRKIRRGSRGMARLVVE
jgi:hypothetical protein